MRFYLEICVYFLIVFASNQIFGKESENQVENSFNNEDASSVIKQKVEIDMTKAFTICDVIWSEENGDRHPVTQDIRSLVEDPKSVNVCAQIRERACSKSRGKLF